MSEITTRFAEFFDVAVNAGHDPDRLRAGETICSYITIPNLAEAGRIMTRLTEAQRLARRDIYFTEAIKARQWLGQGRHDNGESSVIAVTELSEVDLVGLGNHLPLHVKVISVLHKKLAPGEIWDVSVRGSVWGLDDLEELYVLLNVGHLEIGPGASLVVRGNVFSFICQHLSTQAKGPGNAQSFELGILPTPFSLDGRTGMPHDGAHGAAGSRGDDGTDGRPIKLASSLIGPVLTEDASELRLPGNDGANGANGQAGGPGRNGGMCKSAEIAIRHLDGHLTIFSQGGKGGNGGNGGNGGDGGNGGHGANGARTLQGNFPGGNGGNGGNAGNGGFAGHGGNGGLASNIFITLPVEQEAQITRIALPSEPGSGGLGGLPGQPGSGGRGGAGDEPENNGADGSPGAEGAARRAGRLGKSRPAPTIFINEKN